MPRYLVDFRTLDAVAHLAVARTQNAGRAFRVYITNIGKAVGQFLLPIFKSKPEKYKTSPAYFYAE